MNALTTMSHDTTSLMLWTTKIVRKSEDNKSKSEKSWRTKNFVLYSCFTISVSNFMSLQDMILYTNHDKSNKESAGEEEPVGHQFSGS